jgi:hypothetical protein
MTKDLYAALWVRALRNGVLLAIFAAFVAGNTFIVK